jgi:hypothetical protein
MGLGQPVSLFDEDVYPRIAGDLLGYPLRHQLGRLSQSDAILDIFE